MAGEPLTDARSTHALGGESDPHVPVRRVRLVVVAGVDAGMEITTSSERAVIGTHETADLRLTDPTVSRFHCEVLPGVGSVVVRDLGA